jgi:phosphonate transport system substrate-binding protein
MSPYEVAVMIRRRRILFTLGLCAFLILVNPRANAAERSPAKVKTISLGFVSQRTQAEVEPQFREFVDYVARKLSMEGKVVITTSPLQLAKLLEEKKVDFYTDSPYPTYVINTQGAARLLLRRWRGGMAEYHSMLFAKRDGGAAGLENLRGKIFAFEDPGSTSGYFLAKVFLLKKGFRLTEKPALEAKIGPKEIGYIFTHSTNKSIELVLAGKAAAGAFSNDDYGRLDDKGKAALSVLAETETFPRNLVSIRKDLDNATTQRLKEVLLGMHEDPEGRKILERFDGTAKFDPLPGGEEAVRRKLVELYRRR